MRPPLLNAEDQLILDHLLKAGYPQPPGLEEESRRPANPLFAVVEEERVVVRSHPSDRRKRAQSR
jgi:hypothetical protein